MSVTLKYTGHFGEARESFDENVTDVWAGPLHYDVVKARQLGMTEAQIRADVSAMGDLRLEPLKETP